MESVIFSVKQERKIHAQLKLYLEVLEIDKEFKGLR
jgi:hypothetical protein